MVSMSHWTGGGCGDINGDRGDREEHDGLDLVP